MVVHIYIYIYIERDRESNTFYIFMSFSLDVIKLCLLLSKFDLPSIPHDSTYERMQQNKLNI